MERSTSARAILAAVAATAFLWTLALSVSPQLHGRVHSDANRAEHACAVTLMTTGGCDHAGHPFPVVRRHHDFNFSKLPPLAPHKIKSSFLLASIFEHAPPA